MIVNKRPKFVDYYMLASMFELDALKDLASFQDDWTTIDSVPRGLDCYSLDVTEMIQQGLDYPDDEMSFINDLSDRCLDQLRVQSGVFEIDGRWGAALEYYPDSGHLYSKDLEQIIGMKECSLYVLINSSGAGSVQMLPGNGRMLFSNENAQLTFNAHSLFLRFSLTVEDK
jgi:hypothetical protein